MVEKSVDILKMFARFSVSMVEDSYVQETILWMTVKGIAETKQSLEEQSVSQLNSNTKAEHLEPKQNNTQNTILQQYRKIYQKN